MVRYICRRCGGAVGDVASDWRSPALGLTALSSEDQEDFIDLSDTGEVATVKILCDACLDLPDAEDLWYN